MENEGYFDPLQEAVSSNKKSNIGQRVSNEDLVNVWNATVKWTHEHLLDHKTVTLKNIGLFSVSNWKLLTGIRTFYVVTKPVFFLSEKLVDEFGLKQPKFYCSDAGVFTPINCWSVAKQLNTDRTIVEISLVEISQALARLLYHNKNVQLHFENIGDLIIIDKEIKFNFSQEFLNHYPSEAPTPPEPTLCHKFDVFNKSYSAEPVNPCPFHAKKEF